MMTSQSGNDSPVGEDPCCLFQRCEGVQSPVEIVRLDSRLDDVIHKYSHRHVGETVAGDRNAGYGQQGLTSSRSELSRILACCESNASAILAQPSFSEFHRRRCSSAWCNNRSLCCINADIVSACLRSWSESVLTTEVSLSIYGKASESYTGGRDNTSAAHHFGELLFSWGELNVGFIVMTHLRDLSAHLDDIGFRKRLGGGAVGTRGHVGVIREGLWRRGRGHEMDKIIKGQLGGVQAHVCR